MYKDSFSYSIVKNILLKSFPYKNVIKYRSESDILLVMNKEYSLFYFNSVAKDFFELCDGNTNVKQIIDVLSNKYNIEKNILEDDIIDLIKDLQLKRLIYINPMEIDYE